jgi:hypothetical protein
MVRFSIVIGMVGVRSSCGLLESRRVRRRDAAGIAGLDAHEHQLAQPNTVQEMERKVRGKRARIVGDGVAGGNDALNRHRQQNDKRRLDRVACVGGDSDLLDAWTLRRFRGVARLGLLGLLRTAAARRRNQRRFRCRSILDRSRGGLLATPSARQDQQHTASMNQEVAGDKPHAVIIRGRPGKSQAEGTPARRFADPSFLRPILDSLRATG